MIPDNGKRAVLEPRGAGVRGRDDDKILRRGSGLSNIVEYREQLRYLH
jgi:hypothetical protein